MPCKQLLPAVAGLCCALAACAPASTDLIPLDAETGVVDVSPAAPQVLPSESVTFAATLGGAAISVTWSVQEGASGGSITGSDGLYQAPASTGTFHVVATTASGVTGTATVIVVATPVVQVAISPRTRSVTAGSSATFSATVTGSTNTGVSWTVQEGSAGGAVTSTGVYTAPSTPGTYHVVATSVADGTKSDTATITVTATPAVSVAVSPKTTSVAPGGTVTFTATVSNASNTAVTWAVTETACGSITGGVYTAPSSAGTCHVVATSVADNSKTDTATVTVAAPPAGLAAQLAALSSKAVYFGHQSVGGNILAGLQTLLNGNSGAEPRIVQTTSPASMGSGIVAESAIGANGDPAGKFAAFESVLGGASGTTVGSTVDIAMVKLCFADFWDSVGYFSGGGTPASLFAAYQATVARIRAAHPGLTLVHVTVPLWTATESNARREAYNQLLRNAYSGREPLFDVALIESTRADGTRERDGAGVAALVPAYTTDGGHLNDTGKALVARALTAMLAGL